MLRSALQPTVTDSRNSCEINDQRCQTVPVGCKALSGASRILYVSTHQLKVRDAGSWDISGQASNASSKRC